MYLQKKKKKHPSFLIQKYMQKYVLVFVYEALDFKY